MAVINGSKVLIYTSTDGGTTKALVGASTSFTLNINENLPDATTKDSNMWVENIEGNRSWDVSIDGLYDASPTGTDENWNELIALILTDDNNDITLVMGDSTTSGSTYWSGSARLSNPSVTFGLDEAANASYAFTGNGALTSTTVA